MVKTLAQRIAELEAAIARAEEAQASTVGDRSRRNAELKTLNDEYETLILRAGWQVGGRVQALEVT